MMNVLLKIDDRLLPTTNFWLYCSLCRVCDRWDTSIALLESGSNTMNNRNDHRCSKWRLHRWFLCILDTSGVSRCLQWTWLPLANRFLYRLHPNRNPNSSWTWSLSWLNSGYSKSIKINSRSELIYMNSKEHIWRVKFPRIFQSIWQFFFFWFLLYILCTNKTIKFYFKIV